MEVARVSIAIDDRVCPRVPYGTVRFTFIWVIIVIIYFVFVLLRCQAVKERFITITICDRNCITLDFLTSSRIIRISLQELALFTTQDRADRFTHMLGDLTTRTGHRSTDLATTETESFIQQSTVSRVQLNLFRKLQQIVVFCLLLILCFFDWISFIIRHLRVLLLFFLETFTFIEPESQNRSNHAWFRLIKDRAEC